MAVIYEWWGDFTNRELNVLHAEALRLSYNPVFAVELEPEVTPEAERWSAQQAAAFLAASADDPLALLFRIILLFGPPGEAFLQVAEADGNRTRQPRRARLTGFEDRGDHQAPRRLRRRRYPRPGGIRHPGRGARPARCPQACSNRH